MDDSDMVLNRTLKGTLMCAVFDNGNKPTKMETQYREIDGSVHLLIMQKQGPL
jgi:hypothetical protein